MPIKKSHTCIYKMTVHTQQMNDLAEKEPEQQPTKKTAHDDDNNINHTNHANELQNTN